MCNQSCIDFGARTILPDEVRNKRVLEVGAIDVNGNLRPVITALGPSEYVGVDIEPGKGVDVVCRAEDLIDRFGRESFHVVLSTEMLEHVRDWRLVVTNIKEVCRPGGVILLTTRSRGFKYHGFPCDFWRFDLDDMRSIFSDLDIHALRSDPEMPGVMLKARKPSDKSWKPRDLSSISLHSVVTNRRMQDLRDDDFRCWYFRWFKFRMKVRERRLKLKKKLFAAD